MGNKLPCFGLPSETIQKIHGVFKSYPEIKQVCIYGSRAKGNYHPGSDLYQTYLNSASHKDTTPQRKNYPLCLSAFV
ncbi:nucleotidyltransferase domain-containing protein [Desulfobacter postgatei]|uniref:nucleotidyltransferase domain-containing protein n=1 Tax=Desulfobacter postgatei TaxID=2293 RepID=UPI00155ADC2B